MLRHPLVMVIACVCTPVLAEPVVLDPAALFPEGPVLAGDRVLYAQYAGNVVSVLDGSAKSTLWQQDGCGPSAVVPHGAGYLVTCYDGGTLALIGADGTPMQVIDRDSTGAALVGPNDGTPDGQGGAYVTLSGPWESAPIVGRVLHVAADGTATPVADDLHYPNGIALGADGRLYVNESEAGRVISFAVAADGSLSDRRLFVRLSALGEDAAAYPDGLKLGPEGSFFIGQYSSGRILEVGADGTKIAVHDTGAAAAPNMTFSADGRTLFATVVDNTAGAPYEGRLLALPLD